LAPVKTVNAAAASGFQAWLPCGHFFKAVSDRIARFGPFSFGFPDVSESLTRGKSGEKESPRLAGQNRRMFPAMRTILQTPCERVQLTLTVALLAACAANVALVCAWL
jgi:hypothetical protein